MKIDIHPKYFPTSKVKCACGNTYIVGSTKENTEVEICNARHPFFTGKERLVDSAGRVENSKPDSKKDKAPVVKKKEKPPRNNCHHLSK